MAKCAGSAAVLCGVQSEVGVWTYATVSYCLFVLWNQGLHGSGILDRPTSTTTVRWGGVYDK